MPGLRTTPAFRRLRKALFCSIGPLASLVVTAGCVSASAAGAPSPSPAVLASPAASPSPVISELATAATAAAVSPSGVAPAPPPATVDVSPAQVQVGAVMLSMSLEPARHMLAQTAGMTSDSDPAHKASAGDPAPTSTALVLDGLLSLTNNLDAREPLHILHAIEPRHDESGGKPVLAQ